MTSDHFSDQSPPATANHAHPPYAEMIIAAITALKDRDGSSRQAISKYIEKEFANLPPTHSTLLTHHLKRLKNLGQLVMVKHSYMLPRSAHFQPPDATGYQPAIDFSASGDVTDVNVGTGGFNLENLGTGGSTKRRPGRPPKLKPVPNVHNQVQGYNAAADADADADVQSYQPQFQYHGGSYGSGSAVGGSEPLFASLGLGDDGVVVPAVAQSENVNTPAVVKRGRGRPPKSASGESQALVVGSGSGGGQNEVQPVRKQNGVRVKKGRGRPKRVGFGAVTVPLSGNYLRPRGRPKRVGRPSVLVNGGAGAGAGVLGSRRRGRPSRKAMADLTGKPLESVSKGGLGTAVVVTDPQQLVVYQELKSKYEHLQSKVKVVASMVKPCIHPDYGNSALAALQELEDMAADVNAPSRDQAQI
ncbi:hypothetical protein QVD17_41959 [Tagetes erecta]|uniref:H15 domain-containing protein n=1 Tax=Tagetes erecta TaxID=13708 RepID=A0AAD8NFY9_TARER|nr:hypothetical protein QVD17_41959 [Tagetes erecta]